MVDSRTDIEASFAAGERQLIADLIASVDRSPDQLAVIEQRALARVQAVRATQSGAFDQLYDLSQPEGRRLLALAEALPRICDDALALQLLRDTLMPSQWQRAQRMRGATATAISVTLDLAAGILARTRDSTQSINRFLLASARTALSILSRQYVFAETIESAVELAKRKPEWRYSFDMLGEAAVTDADAGRFFQSYRDALLVVGRQQTGTGNVSQGIGISVKLSALTPRFEITRRERVIATLLPRVRELASIANRAGINLTIDAEEAERLTLTLDVFEAVLREQTSNGWNGLGLAVQAYQRRAPAVIRWLIGLARNTGKRIPVRLVKGAYWDAEIKYAQQKGFADFPVYTRKEATDVAFVACAKMLLDAPDAIYCQFATHNAHTVEFLLRFLAHPPQFEFQRLHGMGAPLYRSVMANESSVPCRVYAPIGPQTELLPYLVRRLLENGANSSFVNQLADVRIPAELAARDPIAYLQNQAFSFDPAVTKPDAIYLPDRINSRGFSFEDRATWQPLQQRIAKSLSESGRWVAEPILNGKPCPGNRHPVCDPALPARVVGYVTEASAENIARALAIARSSFESWTQTPVTTRAAILDRAANMIEAQRDHLIALAVREAGKCVPDAIAETREAVDLLRYYAAEARRMLNAPQPLPGPSGETNTLSLQGRGVFVCISPWNFPLAIFLGQLSAALVAGNTVIAKPAEQTPLTAAAATRILLEAGLPAGAIALIPGDSTTGAALVQAPDIDGVCFTGSTATARAIHQSLAARQGAIVPLIAETGGINALIADSSAHPEQLVLDVVQSAFNSAGQRCSALRLLLVQAEIAPKVLSLLQGAIATLIVDDPASLSTDVGPVIDASASASLHRHVQRLDAEAKLLGRADVSSTSGKGYFIAPQAYEIPSIEWLEEEVFGPILHVVRYSPSELDAVLDAINAKGYGLTLGIHTRVESAANYIVAKMRVGNVYVNRNIIGATVGTQPFGGENLSGTGPKAGGPHYLMRFVCERTLTINTAAIGGDAQLLSRRSN